MKKSLILILIVTLLLFICSCTPSVAPPSSSTTSSGSGSSSTSSSSGSSSSSSNQDVPPSPSINISDRFFDSTTINNADFYKNFSEEEKNLYYHLWDENTKIEVKIDIEPKELAKINEAYKNYRDTGNSTLSDTYRKCNLTIVVDGKSYYYDEVGIRMRGNTSRREFCDDNGNIYAYVHFRFKLNETFDGEEYADGAWASDIQKTWTDASKRKERKNRTFATMEKFYYKWNKNYDNTYLREVYANRFFRAYGILAPHITLANVSLKQNGQMENLGVCTLYETIDKEFLKRNFSKAERGGDLYKCTYTTGPADLTSPSGYGVETPTQRFNYSLKTNDDREAPDYNHNKYLLALIDALNTSKDSPEFKEKLESIVDMDYFTNFEAVNYLLGNPDCIRNNANNYYLYFVPTTGEAFFIPYDYDRCLGINMDWNPTGDGMTTTKPYAVEAAVGRTNNPLYTKTILDGGLDEYKQIYKQKLNFVLNGEWFTYNNFKKIFDSYKATYADLVSPSNNIKRQCGGNLRLDRFEFSERGTNDLGTNQDNITVENYIKLKRSTALKNL